MNSHRAGVFTVEERNRIYERILEIAHAEERIVAGAVVGSLAAGEGDRWSDLDLAFGVLPENQTLDVLDSLTAPLVKEFSAVHLFDLPHRESAFRVLLLQGCLQVDLSVTPASKFGPNGPKFRIPKRRGGSVCAKRVLRVKPPHRGGGECRQGGEESMVLVASVMIRHYYGFDICVRADVLFQNR
jgi:predicted nucleotidyltransferase